MATEDSLIKRVDIRPTLPECKDFVSLFKAVMINRRMMALSCFNYDIALKYLTKFAIDNEVTFKSINGEWLETFRDFLLNTSSLKNEQRLSANSASTYYSIVLSVVNEAIRYGYVTPGVCKNARPIKRAELKTVALSETELTNLAEAHCDCIRLKRAFLLSALTGIQWNELKELTWSNIESVGNLYQLNLSAFKDPRIIPLNEQAYGLLDQSKQPDEKMFLDLKWNSYLYVKLNKWAIRAGILRNLTFQTARVTFARLLHEKGIPTEIISELLGHKHPKSTVRFTQQYLSAVA